MEQSPPTILVVDNDEALTAAISMRLEDAGFNCITAASGAQGIALFDRGQIDLVITDVVMPGGDGFVLAEHIRKAGDTPVIVCTGYRKDHFGRLGSVPGVTVFEKPFSHERLLELVETELILAGVTPPG